MRSLHLIEEGWAASEAMVGAMALSEHQPADVLLIGGSDLERRASELGLSTTDRIAPAGRLPRWAGAGLRAYVRDRGVPGTIWCWSSPAARLVERNLRGSTPVLMETCVGSTPRGRASRLPRPALAASPPRREAVRRMMGLDDRDVLVVPVATDDGVVDAWRVGFIWTVLETAGAAFVAAVPRRCRRVRRARRAQRLGMRPLCVRWVEAPAAWLLEGADIGLSLAERPRPRWTIARAQAWGVPVVCEGREGKAGLVPDHPELFAAEGVSSDIARRLMSIAEDPELRRELARCVRAHATDSAAVTAVAKAAAAVVGG